MEKEIQSIVETQVGITHYITKGQQILAVTKYLLTDFIVNQIDLNGNLITLHHKPQQIELPKKAIINYELSKQIWDQCKNILGQQLTLEIQKLYEKIQSGQKISKWQQKLIAPKQKQQRIKIHDFIRDKLEGIDSSTFQGNIKLEYRKNIKKRNPLSRKKYIHFTLFKSNIDTAGALFKLSKITGLSQKLYSTAGLKDKRGVTTQRVSLYNSDIQNLLRFYSQSERNKQIWIDDILQQQQNPIGIGHLIGNQFGLILRLIHPKDAQTVQQRIKVLRDVGMVNYFGLQRFGSYKTKTHTIGLELIKKNWKKVVETLLLQDTGNNDINDLKSQLYYNQRFGEAERSLPSKNKLEKLLFRALNKYGNNYLNVFDSLPRSMKTIYIHAVQSYIWNKITSRRLEQYGLTLAKGDLVGIKINKINKQPQNQVLDNDDNDQIQQEDIEDQQYQLKLINQENIHQFTIYDLLAPLYGPSTMLTQDYILYKYIQDQLKLLGLKANDFLDNSKLLCFQGRYRKLIIKPESVSSKIIKHQMRRDQLQSPFYTIGQELKVEPGQLCSIQLVLRLPKSSYATMALRQILHIPSSLQAQKQLNLRYNDLKE